MAVKIDIIDGASLTHFAGRIQSMTRIARITGLTGSSNTLRQAVSAVGMPVDGDVHPNQSDMYVQGVEIRGEPSSTSAMATITYRYEPRVNPIISGGVTSQQVQTQKYRDGTTIIEVQYGTAPAQVAEVSVFISGASLIFQLAEATSTPGSVAVAYANTTNSTTWNGYGAGKWLCNDVQFTELHPTLATPVWLFTYQFSLNYPDGWNPVAAAIDSQTGRPPKRSGLTAPELAAAVKTVTWYDQVNFNTKFP